MLRRLLLLLALALALGIAGCASPPPPPTAAATTTIKEVRVWHAPQRTRVVFDMNRRAALKVLKLKDPERVVLDLSRVRLRGAIPDAAADGRFIRRVRLGARPNDITRVVFDLAQAVRPVVKVLSPTGAYQYRLVVDFYSRDARDVVARSPRPSAASKDDLLILLDPGHGGEDPGAVGKRTYEKKVVLAIAKKLKARIDRQPGLRAELTRSGDYYIPLRRRTDIARRQDAALFVSLHADAFKSSRVRGASVYALSQHGATSETAKWLANKENAADLAGGVNLAQHDDQLAGVLLDLSMTDTVNESIRFGEEVLAELKKIGRVHFKRVEQAGFVVLKSPDIPSILVETAYITNPHDEKLLMSSSYQNRIAAAIVAGIKRYLAKNKSRYVTR